MLAQFVSIAINSLTHFLVQLCPYLNSFLSQLKLDAKALLIVSDYASKFANKKSENRRRAGEAREFGPWGTIVEIHQVAFLYSFKFTINDGIKNI